MDLKQEEFLNIEICIQIKISCHQTGPFDDDDDHGTSLTTTLVNRDVKDYERPSITGKLRKNLQKLTKENVVKKGMLVF